LIYAIQAVGTEYVKIGFADRNIPLELRLIAFGDGDVKQEKHYQRWLKREGVHHRGEWFVRGKEVDRVIDLIRERPLRSPDVPAAPAKPKQISPAHPRRLARVLEYAEGAL
jgi:hypothetical protein